jgi:hypothetical protein
MSDRLTSINLELPKKDDNLQVCSTICDLLAGLPGAHTGAQGIAVLPQAPLGSLPVTQIVTSNSDWPAVHFTGISDISVHVGSLYLYSDNSKVLPGQPQTYENTETKQDKLGSYYELNIGDIRINRLDIRELAKRLTGHVTRLDHWGVNMPTSMFTAEQWQEMLQRLAVASNVYNYPEEQPWKFILPATDNEFNNDITDFPQGREPRFELVHDTYGVVPELQIDIETDLTRQEIEGLFPAPYGISYPAVADYFRTVYVHHPWRGLNIRFDIRFAGKPSDWESGRWLVQKGGRIEPVPTFAHKQKS